MSAMASTDFSRRHARRCQHEVCSQTIRADVLDGEDNRGPDRLIGSGTTLRDIPALLECGPDAVDHVRDELSRISAPHVP